MQQLEIGERLTIPLGAAVVDVRIEIGPGSQIDTAAFGLQRGILHDDRYMVFYNQPASPDGAIRFSKRGHVHHYAVRVAELSPAIDRISFTVSGDSPLSALSVIAVEFSVAGVIAARHSVPLERLGSERALMLIDLYRHGGGWRAAVVSAGYAGGLKQLVEGFGGRVEDSPLPASSPLPVPSNLPVPPAPTPTGGRGMLSALSGHIQHWRGTQRDLAALKLEIGNAAAAGRPLEPATVAAWQTRIDALGLRGDAGLRLRQSIVQRVAERALEDGRVGDTELAVIEALLHGFVLPATALSAVQQRLTRARQLTLMESGHFTAINPGGVMLRRGEQALWRAAASTLEEKVVRREYRGGSQGVSVRLMKGVTYRVGATRGHSVEQRGVVETSRGELTVTDLRLIYLAPQKSLELPYSKFVGLSGFRDALSVSISGSGKTSTFKLAPEDVEAVLLIVTHHATV